MPPSPHPPPTAPRPSGVCLASSLNPDRQRLPSPQSPGCSPILTGKRGSLTRLLCCKELSCRGCSSLCLLAEHGVQCPGTRDGLAQIEGSLRSAPVLSCRKSLPAMLTITRRSTCRWPGYCFTTSTDSTVCLVALAAAGPARSWARLLKVDRDIRYRLIWGTEGVHLGYRALLKVLSTGRYRQAACT